MSQQPFRDASNRSAVTTPVSKMARGLGEVSLSKTPGSVGRSRALFTRTPGNGANKKGGLKRREITPSRNHNFTGVVAGADRYMPNRSSSQFELANYHLTQSMMNTTDNTFNTSSSAPCSPAKRDDDKQKMMKMMRTKSASDMGALVAGEEDRILVYKKNSAPQPPVGHMSSTVLYTACVQPSSTVKKNIRHIPTAPDRILDAPGFSNDFYSDLLDWSSAGVVAVALADAIYLWHAETGEISILFELEQSQQENLSITSVKWANEGKFLAIGFSDGSIRLFDPARPTKQELRKIQAPRNCATTCMSWRHHVVSVGYKSGQVVHNDVRIKQSVVGVFEGHSQPVCGMQWSTDQKTCATGGGDNVVCIWDESQINTQGENAVHRLTEHTGSVKAIQFCPFKQSQLASGGGQSDMSVKLWDVRDGKLQKTIDAGAQVTAIRFNSDYREMVAGLGTPTNELKIWKHPTYQEVATLAGHTDRILGLALSPCGQFVMSASADESLRMWHCFKVDKSTQKLSHRSKLSAMSALR